MVVLKDISETVQQVADAMAAVLNMEVEIVGTDLVRVAGTGDARDKIGLRAAYGVITNVVHHKKEAILVAKPGQHPYCAGCALFGRCFYRAQIIYPIIYHGQSVGSISLITFNEVQEKALLENRERLMDFLSRMADLMASKMAEQHLYERVIVASSELQAVINAVEQGIVAVDTQGRVTHMNVPAEKLLRLSAREMVGQSFEDMNLGAALVRVAKTGKGYAKREMLFKNKSGYSVRLLSSAQPIFADGKLIGAVSVIQDIESVGKLIHSLSGGTGSGLENILGKSQTVLHMKAQIKRIAGSSTSVLIRGESGTGKELVARAIHMESQRQYAPFIAINCSAIPETLLESELFGYEDGSFTGAKKGGKVGKFEFAQQGTLFLDEIGDMPLHLQSKLLRVLEEKKFERIGGNTSIKLEARLITATNRNLEDMLAKGEFREDLYYRINVIPFYAPPLRERPEDIELLLTHFLQYYSTMLKKEGLAFSNEAKAVLMQYAWPGNIRELQNTVEYCMHMAEGDDIQLSHLPQRLFQGTQGNTSVPMPKTFAAMEKMLITEALSRFGTTLEGKKQAAEALGIGLTTLYRKGKKYQVPSFD